MTAEERIQARSAADTSREKGGDCRLLRGGEKFTVGFNYTQSVAAESTALDVKEKRKPKIRHERKASNGKSHLPGPRGPLITRKKGSQFTGVNT